MFGTVTTSKPSSCVCLFGKQFGQGSTVIIQVMFGYKMSLVCSVRQVLLRSSKKHLLSLSAKSAPVYGNDNVGWGKLLCRVQQNDWRVSHPFFKLGFFLWHCDSFAFAPVSCASVSAGWASVELWLLYVCVKKIFCILSIMYDGYWGKLFHGLLYYLYSSL